MKSIENLDLQLKHSRKLALATACSGIAILLLYVFTKVEFAVTLGLIYLFAAALLNFVVLLELIILFLNNEVEREKIGYTIFIMLLNILLAIICCFIGLSTLLAQMPF